MKKLKSYTFNIEKRVKDTRKVIASSQKEAKKILAHLLEEDIEDTYNSYDMVSKIFDVVSSEEKSLKYITDIPMDSGNFIRHLDIIIEFANNDFGDIGLDIYSKSTLPIHTNYERYPLINITELQKQDDVFTGRLTIFEWDIFDKVRNNVVNRPIENELVLFKDSVELKTLLDMYFSKLGVKI